MTITTASIIKSYRHLLQIIKTQGLDKAEQDWSSASDIDYGLGNLMNGEFLRQEIYIRVGNYLSDAQESNGHANNPDIKKSIQLLKFVPSIKTHGFYPQNGFLKYRQRSMNQTEVVNFAKHFIHKLQNLPSNEVNITAMRNL